MSAGCLVRISSRLLDNSKELGLAKNVIIWKKLGKYFGQEKKYFMFNKLFKTKQNWQQTWKVFELEQTFNWKVFELGKTLASIWTSKKLGKCLD